MNNNETKCQNCFKTIAPSRGMSDVWVHGHSGGSRFCDSTSNNMAKPV